MHVIIEIKIFLLNFLMIIFFNNFLILFQHKTILTRIVK